MPPRRPIDRDRLACRSLSHLGRTVKFRQDLVSIILDTANLGASAAEIGGRPPYTEILGRLAAGRAWTGTAVVLAQHCSAGMSRFVDLLRTLGLKVIVSHRRVVCGRAKASDDVVIAAEAICAAHDPSVSEVVLCSGDGDLAHVLEVCRRVGKPCAVASYRHSLSSTLANRADRVAILDELHADATAEAA